MLKLSRLYFVRVLFIFCVISFLFVIAFFVKRYVINPVQEVEIKIVNSNSVDSIISVKDAVVQPVLYTVMPDLKDIEFQDRLDKFVDLMLPSVLLAQEKMRLKKEKVVRAKELLFTHKGSREDSLFIEKMKDEYHVESVDEVINRLHAHPVSIILAQAAIESGWGTSRFCMEANNIFGIWSYDASENRIVASETRNGKNIYLRKYDSIFESIYDYLETIARANAYKQFRKARLTSNDPFRLIWYLSNYSEKRYEYVRLLRNIIEYYDFFEYDIYHLAKMNNDDKKSYLLN